MGVVLADQIIKICVKTSMALHESVRIASWFYIYFTENKGMAFGWDFIGTLFLSSFRIVAVALLTFYLVRCIKRNAPTGLVVCLSMILAGAAGNIFDNAFYGLIFDSSIDGSISQFVPFGSGYSGFLQGHVVDMFYFPIIDTYINDYHFIFFSPIFNLADASISCGGIALLLFYHRFLSQEKKTEHKEG